MKDSCWSFKVSFSTCHSDTKTSIKY